MAPSSSAMKNEGAPRGRLGVFDGKNLPVLDFAPYLEMDGASKEERAGQLEELAEQLSSACEEVGFYFLTGVSGLVPDDLVRDMFDLTARFHGLDMSEKMALKIDKGGTMGYMGNMGSVVNPDGSVRKGDEALKLHTSSKAFNEAYFMSRGHGIELERNTCPDEAVVPRMRQLVSRYDAAMRALVDAMLPVYARALDMPLPELQRMFTDPLYNYRLTHYPETPVSPHGELYGIDPHADTDFFTVLAPNDVPGLSVRLKDKQWLPVPAWPLGTFLVNSGEMLYRLTNGRFVNAIHSVDNKSGRERYAVVTSLVQDRLAVLTPMVDPGQLAKWPPFTCRDVFKETAYGPKGTGAKQNSKL